MAKKQSECQTNAISEEVPLCDFPGKLKKLVWLCKQNGNESVNASSNDIGKNQK